MAYAVYHRPVNLLKLRGTQTRYKYLSGNFYGHFFQLTSQVSCDHDDDDVILLHASCKIVIFVIN